MADKIAVAAETGKPAMRGTWRVVFVVPTWDSREMLADKGITVLSRNDVTESQAKEFTRDFKGSVVNPMRETDWRMADRYMFVWVPSMVHL